jgi:DNA (cytosine-5)-methyltransferase 1
VAIKFIDLFAGIGGFHAAGTAFGWKCVMANELDEQAARIYEINWGVNPLGNIHDFTKVKRKKEIPSHDVLFAGFPCQPFSKSGRQLGMNEDRGSLFHDIAFVIEKSRPSLVVLENVRNIAGPRHAHEWNFIILKLRKLGYRVSSKPFVVSPHRIPPSFGGTPQARERVFIVGTRLPSKSKTYNGAFHDVQLRFPTTFEGWDPNDWNLTRDLPIVKNPSDFIKYRLSNDEISVLDVWDELIKEVKNQGEEVRLPGFPLWSDIWGKKPVYKYVKGSPDWKLDFEFKNRQFYLEYKRTIDNWFKKHPEIRDFAPSKRKLEWQAQQMESIWGGLIHFRPSGIRVKRATYVPALVAITQTSIVGPLKRRITPQEAALLQGLPRTFSFQGQSDSTSYKQLGNGVSVGAVYQVIKAAAIRDHEILKATNPKLLNSILKASDSPEGALTSEKEVIQRKNILLKRNLLLL